MFNIIGFFIAYLFICFVLFQVKSKRILYFPFFSIGLTVAYFNWIHPYIKFYIYKPADILEFGAVMFVLVVPLCILSGVFVFDLIDFYIVRKQIKRGNFKKDVLWFRFLTKMKIQKTKKILNSAQLKNISQSLRKGLTINFKCNENIIQIYSNRLHYILSTFF